MKKMLPKPNNHDLYPFLLVNIGSGVSILKITGEGTRVRHSSQQLRQSRHAACRIHRETLTFALSLLFMITQNLGSWLTPSAFRPRARCRRNSSFTRVSSARC
ncbi:hypothetical protein PI124_g23490 [Phytophthora idaei]|nr:hypothetical protein PI124_g23490 [Phytophthora idaei]